MGLVFSNSKKKIIIILFYIGLATNRNIIFFLRYFYLLMTLYPDEISRFDSDD